MAQFHAAVFAALHLEGIKAKFVQVWKTRNRLQRFGVWEGKNGKNLLSRGGCL